jgi:hypothetical protein
MSEHKWSLQREIQKRKMEGLLRSIEARKVQQTLYRPTISVPPVEARTVAPRMKPKKAESSVPVKERTVEAKRVARRMFSPAQHHSLIVTIVSTLALITVLVIVLKDQRPSLAFEPFPAVRAKDAVAYLRKIGVPFTSLRTFTVPNAMWNAQDEIEFEVRRGSIKGLFVVLSYNSPGDAGIDAFKATYHQKFSKWGLQQIANILLLSSPDTVPVLNTEMGSHLTQYLVVPYRSFIPTATPVPPQD